MSDSSSTVLSQSGLAHKPIIANKSQNVYHESAPPLLIQAQGPQKPRHPSNVKASAGYFASGQPKRKPETLSSGQQFRSAIRNSKMIPTSSTYQPHQQQPFMYYYYPTVTVAGSNPELKPTQPQQPQQPQPVPNYAMMNPALYTQSLSGQPAQVASYTPVMAYPHHGYSHPGQLQQLAQFQQQQQQMAWMQSISSTSNAPQQQIPTMYYYMPTNTAVPQYQSSMLPQVTMAQNMQQMKGSSKSKAPNSPITKQNKTQDQKLDTKAGFVTLKAPKRQPVTCSANQTQPSQNSNSVVQEAPSSDIEDTPGLPEDHDSTSSRSDSRDSDWQEYDIKSTPSAKPASTKRRGMVSSGKTRVASRTSKSCMSCGCQHPAAWRDWDDFKLCNACGIRYRKYRVSCKKCQFVPRKNDIDNNICSQCGHALR